MRVNIRKIVSAPLRGRSPKGGWNTEIRPEDATHALIAVHTDAGVIGYGSVFTDARLVETSLSVLEPLFQNENALEPERVAEKLHQNTFWMGRGGALTHTISGIDIALWDILGKVTGQPVGRLLGGRYRDDVLAYCSLLMEEPGAMRDIVSAWRQKGFRAFKIGWGVFGRQNGWKTDEAVVRAAREAAGDDARLFVDAGGCNAWWPHGLKWAMRTSDMLSDFNVEWFEEPLPADAIEDYARLRLISRVPIAAGEVLTRRQTFVEWLQRGAVDVVQPDVTKVGGISEQRQIARMAEAFGIKYVGHGWNTAIGVAADMQLASAVARTDLVEFIAGSPYVDDIVSEPFTLDSQGRLRIPDRPGLGINLDRERIEPLTPDVSVLFEAC